jgi:hypothetical protein
MCGFCLLNRIAVVSRFHLAVITLCLAFFRAPPVRSFGANGFEVRGHCDSLTTQLSARGPLRTTGECQACAPKIGQCKRLTIAGIPWAPRTALLRCIPKWLGLRGQQCDLAFITRDMEKSVMSCVAYCTPALILDPDPFPKMASFRRSHVGPSATTTLGL